MDGKDMDLFYSDKTPENKVNLNTGVLATYLFRHEWRKKKS